MFNFIEYVAVSYVSWAADIYWDVILVSAIIAAGIGGYMIEEYGPDFSLGVTVVLILLSLTWILFPFALIATLPILFGRLIKLI